MHHSIPLRTACVCRARQTGATLVVGLVLLLVLTVLGVSGMNTATMEVTMAGNAQFQQEAFQAAEDAIDIVLDTRGYNPDVDTVVDWLGNPDIDRRARTSYRINTMVPDDMAFSAGVVEAFHFDVTSFGRGGRGGASAQTQSFYVIGQAL